MSEPPPPRDDLAFRVVSRRPATPAILELWLEPEVEAMPYLPGQYLLLGPPDPSVEVRSYSMANASRDDGRVRLFVTREPGGETSGWIHDRLAVDDPVLVSGPYGTFLLDDPAPRPILGLAGGSGLAPILAIVEGAVRDDPARPAAILLSARTESDVFGRRTVEAWRAEGANVRFLRTLTREAGAPPVGHVQGVLPELLPDLGEHHVFVAGAPGFVETARRAAEASGAARIRIHDEPFFPEPRP